MSLSQDHFVSEAVIDIQNLFKEYEHFKYCKYVDYHIKSESLHSILKDFVEKKFLKAELLGHSVENRPIYAYTFGDGPIEVLCWTQMHGDEPTATLALLDFIHYLSVHQKSNDFLRERVSLHMIPVLNPDGAEYYCRRNAFDIDINRDARVLISPEAQILKDYADRRSFDFALNMHDQEIYYGAGQRDKATFFSLLAPMPCEDASTAAQFKNFATAKALSYQLWQECESIYPGQIARYYDEFEPRAFGECFQNKGICTLLMEAGGSLTDVDKRDVRKLYCLAFTRVLWFIANGDIDTSCLVNYPGIPLNVKMAFFDLIIRNVQIEKAGKATNADIGIRRYRKFDKITGALYFTSLIEDIGDLSIYNAYEEIDASGLQARSGEIYEKTVNNKKKLSSLTINELLEKGITYVRLKNAGNTPFTYIPCNLIHQNISLPLDIKTGNEANMVLGKPGKPATFAIINGFTYSLMTDLNFVKNARVYHKSDAYGNTV